MTTHRTGAEPTELTTHRKRATQPDPAPRPERPITNLEAIEILAGTWPGLVVTIVLGAGLSTLVAWLLGA